MKIFIFCGPLAFGKGGMEKVAANLANYLSPQNIVTLGYFSREGQTEPAYEVDPQVILAPWVFKAEGSRLAYSKRIIESQSDIFIYFGASSQAIQVISLLWKCNIPILMHEGSNPERVITTNWALPRKISRYEAAWERELIYEHATAIRFTMPEYLNSLPIEMRYKARAFPNAFAIPEEWGQGDLNKRIINVGGLKPNKDIIPLLDVCRELFDIFPEWSLHVFSAKNKTAEGEKYVKEVEEKIHKYKLKKNIFIRGEVDALEEEYLHSDIHIITSFSEGLSNAVAESMTYGIPTIGIKDVPGVDGLVKHGTNGFLVDRGNLKNDLLLYLKKLIQDEQLRKKLAQQARQDSAMFDPQKVNKEWERLIQYTVGKKIGRKYAEQEKHYQKLRGDFYRKVVKGFGVETGSEEACRELLNAQQPNESLLADKEIKAERGRWIDE
ncbi:glycosyltransferase [Halomonas sp. LS-001]